MSQLSSMESSPVGIFLGENSYLGSTSEVGPGRWCSQRDTRTNKDQRGPLAQQEALPGQLLSWVKSVVCAPCLSQNYGVMATPSLELTPTLAVFKRPSLVLGSVVTVKRPALSFRMENTTFHAGEPGVSASFTFSLTIPAPTLFSNTWPTYCKGKTEALVPGVPCGDSGNPQPGLASLSPRFSSRRGHSGGSPLQAASVG